VYSVVILMLIFFHALKSTEKNLLQQKLFVSMLLVTVFLLITDILSRFDGRPGTTYAAANQVGNFIIFLLSPVLPSLWLLYVQSQVKHDTIRIKRWLYIIPAINVINLVAVVLSQFLGWLYYIGADNIYHRGPLFWIPVLMTIVLAVSSFVLTAVNYKNIEKKYFRSLMFFPIPPIVCVILQLSFYGVSLMLNGAALSLLIIFISIQNQKMNTDYLTGAYNRKGLDIYLRQRIDASTENKTFSAILLDLDKFKAINDTFGHNIGDCVLVSSVRLLKTCLSSNDFIARFGGDEFYIILNISSIDELEAAVRKITDCLAAYNDKRIAPFKLSASMGYAVYNYHSRQNAAEFLQQVDALMYANKISSRKNDNYGKIVVG
jgi:diguanylate cyclase (GGDEF)-like protein